MRSMVCRRSGVAATLVVLLSVSVGVAAVIGLMPAMPAQARPSGQDDAKAIQLRLRGLRKLSDADRAHETKQLALDIRKVGKPLIRLELATDLADLATEGDFGHDTLQEVANTLSGALQAQSPGNGNADSYSTLAQLIRYENVRVPADSPPLSAALAKLEEDDRRRQDADFTLTDLQGKRWNLASLHGKVVLVNFWATWCLPCRKEIPDLEALYNQFVGRGFVVLGISDENVSKVQPFVDAHHVTYPILLDPGRKINDLYMVQGIPRTLIYDRNGKLAAEAIDMRTRKQLLALLARAGLSE